MTEYNFRVSDEEYNEIKMTAGMLGISVSHYFKWLHLCEMVCYFAYDFSFPTVRETWRAIHNYELCGGVCVKISTALKKEIKEVMMSGPMQFSNMSEFIRWLHCEHITRSPVLKDGAGNRLMLVNNGYNWEIKTVMVTKNSRWPRNWYDVKTKWQSLGFTISRVPKELRALVGALDVEDIIDL